MQPEEFPTRYDQNEAEPRIYAQWEASGYFNPDRCIEDGITAKDADYFSIVLPPPNVTGTLHLGHAFEDTIQDIAVRYNRMRGHRTLWVPGTDHAAIATQSKVESIIVKTEKKNRHDLGREEFLRRVHEFAQQSHDTIIRQVKRMGASLDWSREAYTLDETRNLAVRTAFKRMYDLGLIYRGARIVNWDPKGQTTVSDDEVVHEEVAGKLYTFRYDKNFPISISTTRPETKVGDTAVAVHPKDDRYKKYIGKEYKVQFAGKELIIRIVADENIDPAFGTGAVGITPDHSMTDWEIAEKNNLPHIQVINEYAKMTEAAGPLVVGKKTLEAREIIVDWLRENSLLENEENITLNLSKAERSGGTVEPLPKLQWFIDVNAQFTLKESHIKGISPGSQTTLKEIMKRVVEDGQVHIVPERFEKVYYNWIDNLRDWCISRQLWFGHRIPVWYRGDEIYCDIEAPTGEGWEQDSDTLDTWFSSGMWTFSTLGWPNKESADLKNYHPTTFMAPGYEIIFMWVARMVLMTGCLLGEIPFKTVYLHGIVRDKNGEKFSKSKGNGIDPLEMAEKYGADALRMALIAGASPGNDVKFDESRVKGYRNFATKIWNASRFVIMNKPPDSRPDTISLLEEDKELLNSFKKIRSDVAQYIEQYDFHLASEIAYHYFWHTFADKIIESMKPRLKSDDLHDRWAAYLTLEEILLGSLIMLHPFMPFITEDIFQKFYPGKILMVQSWGDKE